MIAKKILISLGAAVLFVVILIYTRFVGIDWGLPYPMHPDERNMVVAILGMTCQEGWSLGCLSPNFYAYGQFPLFIGYFMSLASSVYAHTMGIDFNTVVISLRALSAVSSVATVFVLIKIATMLSRRSLANIWTAGLLFIFSPVFIQFSHFGTTESLLMFFVILLVYYSIFLIQDNIPLSKYVLFAGLAYGLAVSTKVSSVFFAVIPIIAILVLLPNKDQKYSMQSLFFSLVKIAAFSVVVFVVTSPFNLIDWEPFIHSMNYESEVGIGIYKAFYTRQFEYTIPWIFQFIKTFPYALGIPMVTFATVGFVLLPWKREYIFLRLSAIALFLPNAYLYAKWSRFYAPVYPIILLIGTMFFVQVVDSTLQVWRYESQVLGILRILGTLLIILPGVAYLAIYQNPDVRFMASKWIYTNIQSQSHILSETANVVDIPMPNPYIDDQIVAQKNLQPVSFDFYEVDFNENIEQDLKHEIDTAKYIFVPSRRIYWNHTCFEQISNFKFQISNFEYTVSPYEEERCEKLQGTYPILNAYYDDLFSGKLGFTQVTEIGSYPRIELFGRTIIEFPDEPAEETWTVFDHPVIRIFERKSSQVSTHMSLRAE
ncbi:hypothetical protein CO051_00640 [Candidatus Roizmanbacteria bacterium CG_4_9_14_0_2_um_filter_39_13]|uniref:Uncharacterized protein n=2 Tax=Candidatus Roizmaniibacteriota TaxID=1752723 RepID=A0A2M8F3T6_9BACT|nr:MAG: hypothetical protein CO051_00640 [Candidatus Roizmanbacteria bacterium CG_4_9_14_0_2_um_filter_39_13]PJE61428.1 MAG: hypothetical protein COU87_04655 [Candidatus Roizmanbacteria bacterium CG10_big_fil_rev_8_21_14_0_10_39_12]